MDVQSNLGKADRKKLEENFDNSIFLDEKYDKSIIGIDGATGSIIYHQVDLIYAVMKEEYEHDIKVDPDFQDTEECFELYEEINEALILEFDGYHQNNGDKVPPTLFQELEYVQ